MLSHQTPNLARMLPNAMVVCCAVHLSDNVSLCESFRTSNACARMMRSRNIEKSFVRLSVCPIEVDHGENVDVP